MIAWLVSAGVATTRQAIPLPAGLAVIPARSTLGLCVSAIGVAAGGAALQRETAVTPGAVWAANGTARARSLQLTQTHPSHARREREREEERERERERERPRATLYSTEGKIDSVLVRQVVP